MWSHTALMWSSDSFPLWHHDKPMMSCLLHILLCDWDCLMGGGHQCLSFHDKRAVQQLKYRLADAPILAHPDYMRPLILHTDASTIGLGAVLRQHDIDKNEHSIVYLLCTLNPQELNYTSTKLKCLAIIWAVKKLDCYLDGSVFEISTEHSALQWILDYDGSNKRLVRWSMELQPYCPYMMIRYRPGKVNANAHSLSRAPLLAKGDDEDQGEKETLSRALINTVHAVQSISSVQTDNNLMTQILQGYKEDK